MRELVRLYAEIALLRKGPQDVPASMLLLIVTALAYMGVHILIGVVLPPTSGPWALMVLVDTLLTVAWFAVLLKVLNKPERFTQTTTAVFGYQTVLAPVFVASGWLLHRYAEDTAWQFPLMLILLIVVGWTVAVNSHIFKAALEWSTASCVALAILQMILMQFVSLLIFPSVK